MHLLRQETETTVMLLIDKLCNTSRPVVCQTCFPLSDDVGKHVPGLRDFQFCGVRWSGGEASRPSVVQQRYPAHTQETRSGASRQNHIWYVRKCPGAVYALRADIEVCLEKVLAEIN